MRVVRRIVFLELERTRQARWRVIACWRERAEHLTLRQVGSPRELRRRLWGSRVGALRRHRRSWSWVSFYRVEDETGVIISCALEYFGLLEAGYT